MKKTNQKWEHKVITHALGDSGDVDYSIQFTNGNETFETNSGEEIEDEELDTFCRLLDLMPDLWSHSCDNAQFQLLQEKKKVQHLTFALRAIRDAGVNDKTKLDDLKATAFNALDEIEKGIY